jgi:hypothetical protein
MRFLDCAFAEVRGILARSTGAVFAAQLLEEGNMMHHI